MMKLPCMVLVLIVLIGCASLGRAFAQLTDFSKPDPVVQVSTEVSHTAVAPGGNANLAVVLDVKEGYHINARNAQPPFIPTEVKLLEAPDFVRSSTPVYPQADVIDFGAGDAKESIPVYSDRCVIFIPVAVTGQAPVGDCELKLQVSYQACNESQCLFPVTDARVLSLRVVNDKSAIQLNDTDLFQGMAAREGRLDFALFGWDFQIDPSNLALLLAIAAVGGLLLNFTPCVLPLIPIKIIGLSRAATDRRKCFFLGLTMSAGVVFFWMALAAAIALISGFDATNKLFQYPAFTITVGAVICAMAVGMCGFFSVRLPQWVYGINPAQETLGGSFLFGIMTAVLSTPCTAPLMGAAAAWAATQSPVITLATFGSIGAGMALPYLLLAAFPWLVHRLPRTGPASELIKQVMGILMFAAGMYFLGTGLAGVLTEPPDPPTQVYWWAVAASIVAAGAWLAWRTIQSSGSASNRSIFGGLGAVIAIAGIWIGIRFTEGSPIHWIYYTPDRLAEAQRLRKVVVLEFTAAWCLNCHALEQSVLHNEKVVDALNSEAVAPVKIDITGNNEAGNDKLIEVGRRTIPYLVVYAPDGREVFSSDAYTIDQVLKALDDAAATPPKG